MSETMTFEDLAPLKGETAAPQARVYEKKIDPQGRAYATGKRKDAVARVWVKRGAARSPSTAGTKPSTSPGPCCR